MQLLDQYGRPVKREELKQEVARASLTGIRQIWAPDVAAGITPSRLAAVLLNAAEGDGHEFLALAEQLEERDPHYASVLGTRKRAVSGIEPTVTAASNSAADVKIADAVREAIAESDEFPDLVEDLLDGLGKGYSCVEIDWDATAKSWTPVRYRHRDPRFFRFDRETLSELRLLTDDAPVDGVELPPFKFLTHYPRLKTGIPLRGGIARLAAFTWICKAYTVKDWVAFAELFGLPLRIGRYDGSATKADIETLYQAVASIGSDAAAVLPKSMEIEFQEIGDGAGHGVFEKLAEWADRQISKAVLGGTMTADDGSSLAQAEVHNEVRLDIRKADARQIKGTINRDLVRPFVDLNFGRQSAYPKLELLVEDPEDVSALVKNVGALADRGMTFKAAEIREKLGLSAPDKDDEVFGGGKPKTAAKGKAELNAAGAGEADVYEETDELAGADMDDWADVAGDVLDPVEQLLRDASTYEEAIERLPELIAEMDEAEIIARLVMANVKARAHGDAADG